MPPVRGDEGLLGERGEGVACAGRSRVQVEVLLQVEHGFLPSTHSSLQWSSAPSGGLHGPTAGAGDRGQLRHRLSARAQLAREGCRADREPESRGVGRVPSARIARESGAASAAELALDLGSFASVRAFAKEIEARDVAPARWSATPGCR